jgi:tetratricopeptide (TPR) repeat protein
MIGALAWVLGAMLSIAVAPQPQPNQAPPPPPAAVTAFREGIAAQQQERWEDAARAYTRAIDAKPDFAEAQANLGAVLARLGRHDEAVAAYQRALSLAPGLQAVRINLGLAYFRAGDARRAVETFQTVVTSTSTSASTSSTSDPAAVQARALLGLALVEAGRHAEAVPLLEAASARAPDDAALLFALGRAYAGSDSPKGDDVAARLSQLPMGRPLWQHLQGLLHQRQGRHREALAAFEAARAAEPRLPGLILATGISLLSVGDEVKARDAFEQARAQAPRDAVPVFYLGWVDERAGRLPSARAFAEQALAIDPELFEARALFGRVLLLQGEFNEAARHLAIAAQHDADDASIRYLLAQAWQRAGDRAAAAREFDEARRLKAREVARERRP